MTGSELDLYLSHGYFRMQQGVFTCRFVLFEAALCPVHWLRINVAAVQYGPKQRRLLRANGAFTSVSKPFALTDEIETLYALYRDSIDFDAPESVEACLFDGETHNAFDTRIIEIRDGRTLIAAGIFDDGSRSIAGIMNFYHPAYRKYSLGKYLMLQKIADAQRRRKLYYYPGYVASNYPKFDYKLFADEAATEVYDAGRGYWLPFSWETVAGLAAELMDEDRIG